MRGGGGGFKTRLLGELHVNLITNKSFTQNSWVGKMKVIFDILDRNSQVANRTQRIVLVQDLKCEKVRL
jgi:hypothetical protein